MRPKKIDDSALIEEEIIEEITPSPRRVSSEEALKRIDTTQHKREGMLSGIVGYLQKGSVIFLLFVAVFLIGFLYDTLYSATAILQHSPILGTFYLLLILLLGISLLGIVGKEFKGYRKLRRIESLQEEGRRLMEEPSSEVYNFAKKILHFYRVHPDTATVEAARKVEKELDEMLESEVIPRVEEVLFESMDDAAKKCIVKYASQTAVSTAISPVALIDALLILSRSYVMINEIAKIYGYRPNVLGEVVLIKRVFINLAFASITDILAHHSHDIAGSTLLSKISLYSAQGVANGILTARVGLGAITACRPIPSKAQNQGFLKNLTKIIIDRIFLDKTKEK